MLIVEEYRLKDAQRKRTERQFTSEEDRLKHAQRKRTERQFTSEEDKGTNFCSIKYIPTSPYAQI